jgi:hypothetical protein
MPPEAAMKLTIQTLPSFDTNFSVEGFVRWASSSAASFMGSSPDGTAIFEKAAAACHSRQVKDRPRRPGEGASSRSGTVPLLHRNGEAH